MTLLFIIECPAFRSVRDAGLFIEAGLGKGEYSAVRGRNEVRRDEKAVYYLNLNCYTVMGVGFRNSAKN